MAATREQIFQALWALTENLQFNMGTEEDPVIRTWETRERKLRLFSDLSSEQKPYIAQVEHGEEYVKVKNLPYRRTWNAQWFIYHDNAEVPTIINNNILDAIDGALKPKPQDPGYFDNRNTLMGLVYACFIEGEIFKDPGDIDNQAMMVIPIKLLVP